MSALQLFLQKKVEVELEPIIWGYDFRALHSKKKKRGYINIIIQSLIQWAEQYSTDVCIFLVSERPGKVREEFITEVVSSSELNHILSKNLSRDNILLVLRED
jgi:hypothetical protein